MRLIEAKNGAIDVSPDVLIAHINSILEGPFYVADEELEHTAEGFLRLDLEDVLWILGQRGFSNLRTIRALAAHGKSDYNGSYVYIDRNTREEPAPFVPIKD